MVVLVRAWTSTGNQECPARNMHEALECVEQLGQTFDRDQLPGKAQNPIAAVQTEGTSRRETGFSFFDVRATVRQLHRVDHRGEGRSRPVLVRVFRLLADVVADAHEAFNARLAPPANS